MHMRYSFIDINSVMHSVCFCSCVPMYEMELDVHSMTAKKTKTTHRLLWTKGLSYHFFFINPFQLQINNCI